MQLDNLRLRRAARLAGVAAIALAAACSRDGSGAPPRLEPGAAPEAAVATAAKDDGKPAFEIVPPRFDLGVLEPNEKRDLECEVVNRSDRPFSIAYVTNECKCISLDFDRGMIPPGKSSRVRTRVNATSAGMRTTAAILHLTDPKKSKVRIEFHYVIVPDISMNPRKIEFGRIETGKSFEQTVEVSMQLPDEITENPVLEPFLLHDLPIKLTLDPPTVTPPRHGLRRVKTTLHARLESNQPIPMFESMVVFKPKQPKAHRTATLQVFGQVVPAWFFERGVLGFGVVEVGVETSRTMRYFWPGEEPPAVRELKSDVPELTASCEVDKAKHCFVVTIKCLATRPGPIEGAIHLLTSLSEEPGKLRVTARAR